METLTAAVTAAILSLMPLWKSDAKIERAEDLARIITEETQAATPQVDPLLITAMIFKESSFRAKIKGQRGEVGLMQIMPRAPMTPSSARKHLDNARINIRTGIHHLHFWQEKCGTDDMEVWVSAYNAGKCTRNGYGRRVRKLYCRLNPDACPRNMS